MFNRLMTKIILLLAIPAVLSANSCTSSSVQIDPQKEIEKWKDELVSKGKIGTPCNYNNISSPEAIEWAKENPGQMDAFPNDDKEIVTVNADFDGDNKQDLLMYFISYNCTGHNGDTPTFARIVYANGTCNSDLMQEIRLSILEKYKEKQEKEKLKEITDAYFNDSVTITYNNGIKGEFKLYAKDDAHCCPSYIGTYVYNVRDRIVDFEIR